MRKRPALALALAAVAASGTFAFAADAPASSTTSKTLFLSQEGCGSTAGPGRLEVKAQADGATGCGTIGGVPLSELGLSDATDYTTTKTLVAFKVDGTKKVTGQLAAGSWFGAGGVGTVTFEVQLGGLTSAGKAVDFGSTTVSASATGTAGVVYVPFTLSVPATAANQVLKSFTISVLQRGQNFGMSAKQLDGDSYVVIPAKK